MMTNKEYKKQYQAFQNKEITVKEWTKYCNAILDELLKTNQEVLARIKAV